MKYQVSFRRNDVPQAIFVEAPSAEVAKRYFEIETPDAKISDVREATADDERPSKPVLTVKEARWKGAGLGDYYCSLCCEQISGQTEFCPNCHAYMGGIEPESFTLIAKWDNGVQRIFENLDELNVIINKAELDMWCDERKFIKPTYEVIPVYKKI